MKIKSYTLLIILLQCLLSPATCFALPINYSVHGSIVDNQGNTLQISGEMCVDNQLYDWSGNGNPSFSSGAVGYHITGYTLQVGNYSFSGANGDLYMMLTSPYNPTASIYDSMWFLNNGIGAWNNWTGEQFYFFNADGTIREYNEAQYFNLAPMIQFTALLTGAPSEPYYNNLYMWLTQESSGSSAPVPEPITFLLFGSSLFGMLAYRKGRR